MRIKDILNLIMTSQIGEISQGGNSTNIMNYEDQL